MSNVVFVDFKEKRAKIQEIIEEESPEDTDLLERITRIRNSVERINLLMAEMRLKNEADTERTGCPS